MRAPLLRILAVAVLGAALVGVQTPAPAAAEPTASVTTADGCVDGAKVTKVHLTAADGADTTFTTVVDRGSQEVFRDASRVVPAGTTQDVSIPGLVYGQYGVRVYAEGEFLFGDTIFVGCPPVGDYTNPGVGASEDCDGNISYYFENRPIKGATGNLLAVKFALFDDDPSGTRTVLTFTLPDDDADPYRRIVTFSHDRPRPEHLRLTADGEPLQITSFAIPSCVPDTDGPDLPNTGF